MGLSCPTFWASVLLCITFLGDVQIFQKNPNFQPESLPKLLFVDLLHYILLKNGKNLIHQYLFNLLPLPLCFWIVLM